MGRIGISSCVQSMRTGECEGNLGWWMTVFCVVKLKAVEHLCKSEAHDIVLGKGFGLELTGTESLDYVGQMLCGDPIKHKKERYISVGAER